MKKNLDKILAEISAGELIDKITILQIKKEKIVAKDKVAEIEKELKSLTFTLKNNLPSNKEVDNLTKELKEINLKLWDIEDGKRLAEKNNTFGSEFIKLARNVYKYNDERARIKLKINKNLGSNIREVKSHF